LLALTAISAFPAMTALAAFHLDEIGHYFDGNAPFMKVQVIVMPKQSVLDPQGVAVKNAVRDLGLDAVDQVRVGKFLELRFTTSPDRAKLEEICRDLLSNPVIEDYTIQYPTIPEAAE
jgi:phosphoribosylformylglycinamidine synthase subunit PurS